MNKIIMTLAIKGHPTRGREVIQLLEMLGGRNVSPFLKGDALHQFYHIRESNNEIICFTYSTYKDGYKVFTLEEFEEKFPYKVGDKVTLDKYPCVITGMNWDCDDNDIIYYVKGADFSKGVYSKDKDLQPYKEETIEESIDKTNKVIFETNAQCCDICNDIIKKDMKQVKIDIPKGYEFFGIDDDNKIVLTEKQPQYPKTYRECSLINGCEDRIPLKIIEEFIKLINARNAYWKIAGEEMGLGKPWKPDWNNVCDKYTIYIVYGNEIWRDKGQTINTLLAFPTAEMRDVFYENFKDLIEQCKELL